MSRKVRKLGKKVKLAVPSYQERARGMSDLDLRWALAVTRGEEYRAFMREYKARREKDGAWSKTQARRKRKEENRRVREQEGV